LSTCLEGGKVLLTPDIEKIIFSIQDKKGLVLMPTAKGADLRRKGRTFFQ
jgi:hypothetical protein